MNAIKQFLGAAWVAAALGAAAPAPALAQSGFSEGLDPQAAPDEFFYNRIARMSAEDRAKLMAMQDKLMQMEMDQKMAMMKMDNEKARMRRDLEMFILSHAGKEGH
jgi:hypothetical protein